MVPKQIENELHDAVPRFVDTRIGGDLFQDRFAGLAKWFPCCGHFVANVVSRPPDPGHPSANGASAGRATPIGLFFCPQSVSLRAGLSTYRRV